MLGGLEADLQFQRLDIEQEKTYLCVVRFFKLYGTFLLKGGQNVQLLGVDFESGAHSLRHKIVVLYSFFSV